MQRELRLEDRAELLTVGHEIAVLGVLGQRGVLLHLDIVTVEHLVLPVGADKTADKGEDEHDGQNGQAHHRQAVAEEALGHQRAGGQHLNAAVVVQGVILLRLVVLGGRIVLSRVFLIEFIGTAAGIGARHSLPMAGNGQIFILLIVEITHASRPPFSSDAYPRIHHGVQNVGDEVAQQRQDGQERHVEHGERNITGHHGIV